MPGTSNSSGQWVQIGDEKHELIYSMLGLEKIEAQFGSLTAMQELITDGTGEVRLDRPVVTLLIDIIHAGLLHAYDDTPADRRRIASGIPPSALEDIVEAFTHAFTDAFGDIGVKVMAQAPPNRAARRGSPGLNGTTARPSSSKGRKPSGKK